MQNATRPPRARLPGTSSLTGALRHIRSGRWGPLAGGGLCAFVHVVATLAAGQAALNASGSLGWAVATTWAATIAPAVAIWSVSARARRCWWRMPLVWVLLYVSASAYTSLVMLAGLW